MPPVHQGERQARKVNSFKDGATRPFQFHFFLQI